MPKKDRNAEVDRLTRKLQRAEQDAKQQKINDLTRKLERAEAENRRLKRGNQAGSRQADSLRDELEQAERRKSDVLRQQADSLASELRGY